MPADAERLLARAKESHLAGIGLDARLLLAAAVQAVVEARRLRVVLVGGTAVDFWAAEATQQGPRPHPGLRGSMDVDLVPLGTWDDAREARRALHASGLFRPASPGIPVESCRRWLAPEVPIGVEIIGDPLAGDPDRVVELEVDGATAWLWSPEDTAWQYAEHAWSQRSRDDWTRALAIAAAQPLDLDYLDRLAQAAGLAFVTAALRAESRYDDLLERGGG